MSVTINGFNGLAKGLIAFSLNLGYFYGNSAYNKNMAEWDHYQLRLAKGLREIEAKNAPKKEVVSGGATELAPGMAFFSLFLSFSPLYA